MNDGAIYTSQTRFRRDPLQRSAGVTEEEILAAADGRPEGYTMVELLQRLGDKGNTHAEYRIRGLAQEGKLASWKAAGRGATKLYGLPVKEPA